jgi:hypothetical protein
MKKLSIILSLMMACVSLGLVGCANGTDTGTNNEAGAGTSQTSQAPGGPGHGPEGAMNGNKP